MRKPCLTTRCPRYAREGTSYCFPCQRDRWKKGLTGARGSRGDWKLRVRLVKAAAMGRCEDCGARGTTVHHMDRDATNNDLANLRLLCDDCHRQRHAPQPAHNAAGLLGGFPR